MNNSLFFINLLIFCDYRVLTEKWLKKFFCINLAYCFVMW